MQKCNNSCTSCWCFRRAPYYKRQSFWIIDTHLWLAFLFLNDGPSDCLFSLSYILEYLCRQVALEAHEGAEFDRLTEERRFDAELDISHVCVHIKLQKQVSTHLVSSIFISAYCTMVIFILFNLRSTLAALYLNNCISRLANHKSSLYLQVKFSMGTISTSEVKETAGAGVGCCDEAWGKSTMSCIFDEEVYFHLEDWVNWIVNDMSLLLNFMNECITICRCTTALR